MEEKTSWRNAECIGNGGVYDNDHDETKTMIAFEVCSKLTTPCPAQIFPLCHLLTMAWTSEAW